MTNSELDELTALAKDVSDLLPVLLLDGDGQFRNPVTVGFQVVPGSEVLRMLTQGASKARALHAKLAALPRTTRTPKTKQLALEHLPDATEGQAGA